MNEYNRRRENAIKIIQKHWTDITSNRKRYSAKIIGYRSFRIDEFKDIESVKETYRRKKYKFFFRNVVIYNNTSKSYDVEKRIFVQLLKPAYISVEFTEKEFHKYNDKYTFQDLVLNDDKYVQITMDSKGRLKKAVQKKIFNNTDDEWNNLIIDCRQDVNFDDSYTRIRPYLHAIYIYDATSNKNKNDYTEQLEILDVNNYQSKDNNGVCFKHIDYIVNKEAQSFCDLFTFTEANKKLNQISNRILVILI